MSEKPKAMAETRRVPLGIAFMQARMTRDFASAARIGETILGAAPGNAFVRRALARQFDELGEGAKALPHWAALREQEPKDFEAAFHVAQARFRDGATPEDAAASVSTGAFADNLRAVLEAPASPPPQEGVRHVLICGVSYCGSTLFDRLLGSLPGAASIGESHWLVKARNATGYGSVDFSGDFAAELVKCSVCGAKCPVLTADFRRALAADRTDWYFKIARQLNTRLLVSADKNPPKIADHDPLLRFDALVLFKSLPQAWWSELQKRPQGRDAEYYRGECERYVTSWTQSYATFLESFSPQGRVAFLSFEEFTRSPRAVLEAACRALALPFDEAVLTSAKPGHAIGGNMRALSRLRKADYATEILPLPPCGLPAEHLRVIEESAEAARLFDLLQAAHHNTMHG
ncbi:MAG TPA: hypothetical protein VFV07_08585 [Rhizomicrobium sp.]|nr:hypothetical protein [Rhizomicrobium sp.]